MGIRAEVGWSIWREQVTWLAERILLRISMEDILPRLARIHHKGVQLSLLHQPNCYSSPQNARNTRKLLLRETPTDGTDWYRWLGCAEMNNGLNRLNGFYSSRGILPPPRPSYIRAIRGRNILDVRGRPQNTLNTRKTIAERWTNTKNSNNTNFVCLPTSVPSVGGFSLQEVL